jgi:4a-hydroxytetrahydrobiopterin dehydratase
LPASVQQFWHDAARRHPADRQALHRLRRDWQVKNFMAGMEFFREVARLAESEGHHPDLHLEEYRHVWIELWTHAVGGLSENDFILAAKIDRLPVAVRQ